MDPGCRRFVHYMLMEAFDFSKRFESYQVQDLVNIQIKPSFPWFTKRKLKSSEVSVHCKCGFPVITFS